ncbi:type II methionyl aminopeptidase [Candidatus Methanoperedens nitratireducens]|uniref:Methionine aminopeptidase n=1 Tax=Candidatus Methanoperedens nitratireducens TaxID=1392998 RepID=A0A284VPY5_9EURY|nr:type II methionyl aminopeptidase [Candidatus Methanoperedens nitroreducens]SNQ61360.1 Methionine aminopeptidase [Candidatus Methanoperedens nitroreducens]
MKETEEVLEKYRKAGKILSEVRAEAAKKVVEGASLLSVAEFAESLIREKGGEPAFPVNISRNDEAAHSTPSVNDTAVFGKDMVKLDIGVHIDGYIADTAVTVDLSGNPELVKAAEKALSDAIAIIHAGANTTDIGGAIEDAITSFGYKPIINLTGHGLEQYIQHAPPAIPNKRMPHGVTIEDGDIIAIEPFATDGAGKIHDAGNAEIYHIVSEKPVRHPSARALLQKIGTYKTLPFAKRWLGENIDFAMVQLVKANIIRPYPILKEIKGGLISQAEHTVIVTQDGCEVITR